MLLWLVMHINQAMFSPITDSTTLVMLQTFSFIEMLVELVLAITFIAMLILSKEKK